MKQVTVIILTILSAGVFAQQRMVAKASRAELTSLGITGSKEAALGWQVFNTTDTAATAKTLAKAGIYGEVDRKATLYTATPLAKDAVTTDLQWWLTASNGLWQGSFVKAWQITTGSPNVKVGIIDTGSPLRNGRWTNPGLDSIRFIVGPSFVSNSDTPVDSDWANTDYVGHSTHISGIIAAKPNDSVGVCGIDQACKIEVYKSFTEYGWGYYTSIGDALYRAASDSCRVLSMSFGGPWYSRMLEEAVRYATAHNVLCVVAAGNNCAEVQSFPAFFDHFSTLNGDSMENAVLSVGSIDANGNVSAFSNRGYFVDIYAPGGSGFSWPADSTDILSVWPTYYVTLDDTTNGKSPVTGYNYLAGTSMATPMVVGTASLMLSVNPALTAAQIKKIICATADTQMTVAGPVPILDPYKAVIAAKNFGKTIAAVRPMQDPTTFTLSQNYPNPFNPTATISYVIGNRQMVNLSVYDILGQRVATLVDEEKAPGSYTATFDGSKLPSGIYLYRLQAGSFTQTRKMVLVK